MSAPSDSFAQRGPQVQPGIDWSFPISQADPAFARNASGSLSGLPPWASDIASQLLDEPSPSHLTDSTRPGGFANPFGAAPVASRGITSGFDVPASPRPAQAGYRAHMNGSGQPSAGILSVQMNSANQGLAPGSLMHSGTQLQATGPTCIGFPTTTSSGQNMGMSLPASITNSIWAVGDPAAELVAGSAEQRPHLWSSPVRGSPLRPAYAGTGPLQRPLASSSVEVRRAAEASGLCCPLTKDLMSDPVVLISDGYTYERAAINKWLEKNETSPVTQAALQNKDTVPNLTMRSAIQLLIPSANSQRLFPSQLDRRRN